MCSRIIHDSFHSRLKKNVNRAERNSIKEFLIEEFYSIKWGDRKLQKTAILIDKAKPIKAQDQVMKIIKEALKLK